MSKRIEIRVNKVVGMIENEPVGLDYLFWNSRDFHGATGTGWEVVDEDEADNRWKDIESGQNWDEKLLWKEAVQADRTEKSYEEWLDDVIDEMKMECDYPYQDKSNLFMIDDEIEKKIKEHLGYSEDIQLYYGCNRGGRCFENDTEFDAEFEPALIRAARVFEQEKVSEEEARNIIQNLIDIYGEDQIHVVESD